MLLKGRIQAVTSNPNTKLSQLLELWTAGSPVRVSLGHEGVHGAALLLEARGDGIVPAPISCLCSLAHGPFLHCHRLLHPTSLGPALALLPPSFTSQEVCSYSRLTRIISSSQNLNSSHLPSSLCCTVTYAQVLGIRIGAYGGAVGRQ